MARRSDRIRRRMDDRLIGVDVGGTKVSVAVFADGELSEPHVEPTERSSPDALLDQLVFGGATGAAPELGHWVIAADLRNGEPQHSEHFPQPGSLESLAAGTALDRLGRERGFEDGRAVVQAAHRGDERACEAVRL